MSWAPMISTGQEFAGNALRFATREEAEASARSLFQRWTLCTDYKAVESADPVNYAFVDGKDVPIKTCQHLAYDLNGIVWCAKCGEKLPLKVQHSDYPGSVTYAPKTPNDR